MYFLILNILIKILDLSITIKNFKKMSEAKTYVFGEDNNCSSMMSMLAPLLSQRGIDPGVLALMKNNNGFGGEGGWFIWVIFLFFLMGWGNNGWGNNGNGNTGGLANMLNNDTGREMLMSAIQGNSTALSQLSTTLNCDTNAVQQAINSVQNSICQVGNQVGMSGQQVINAIQQGNMTIAQQLSSCCCDIRESVTKMGYESQLATCNQTNNLINSGNQNTQSILNKLSEIQTNNLQDKIDHLREKNSEQAVVINNAQQSNLFGQMIAQATAPINAALGGLTKEVADIQCKLPQTVTLPYSCATAIPTALAYGGLYNNIYPNVGYFG